MCSEWVKKYQVWNERRTVPTAIGSHKTTFIVISEMGLKKIQRTRICVSPGLECNCNNTTCNNPVIFLHIVILDCVCHRYASERTDRTKMEPRQDRIRSGSISPRTRCKRTRRDRSLGCCGSHWSSSAARGSQCVFLVNFFLLLVYLFVCFSVCLLFYDNSKPNSSICDFGKKSMNNERHLRSKYFNQLC